MYTKHVVATSILMTNQTCSLLSRDFQSQGRGKHVSHRPLKSTAFMTDVSKDQGARINQRGVEIMIYRR